jgi:hypothetical protein
MLRLPQPLPQEVARAVYSVEAARVIVVPILDLFYSERAVELACRLGATATRHLSAGLHRGSAALADIGCSPPARS